MKRTSILLVVLVMGLGFAVAAYASLIVRGTDTLGNQLIFDTEFNITWYDFQNTPHDSWDNQMAWTDALTVDFGGTTFSDWRFPTALNQDGTGPCYGFNCTGSEMGHLYYTELGNVAGGPLSTSFTDGLTGLSESFLNLEPAYHYWSDTEYSPFDAWIFDFERGYQGYHYKDNYYGFFDYAIVVRPGDVIAIPESGTILLMGMGLTGMVLLRKRLGRIHR